GDATIHRRVRGTGAVFQNSPSACTHSLSGILQLGRTAKTRPPWVRAATSAAARVRKARRTYSVESGVIQTDPVAGRRARVTFATKNRAPAIDHAGPRLRSGR